LTLPVPQTALDVALTESRSLRAQHMTRTDVLDKVKALSLLPDNIHATTEIVAGYFEVDAETIKKVVQRNRDELTENGYRVVKGAEMPQFVGDSLSLTKVRALALFTRRTILNVAQLLTDSEVARRVRTYLLDVEQVATPEIRSDAIRLAEEAAAKLKVLGAADATGLLDRNWLTIKARVIAAQGIGEAPEIPANEQPLYVPDFLKGKGLTKKEINSVQSWFGRRAVEMGEANGIDVPELRPTEQTNGSIRDTRAWRREHLPLFEQVWDTYYAEKYTRPLALELGGAA
jgi:hypothetical protein